MYEPFFGLNQRPFAPAPFTERYFAARVTEAARQSLARCIERGTGAALLSGPAGTGKTLLLRMLAEQFKDRFAIAALDNGHFSSRRDLLQAILFELGLPYRGLEEGELRLSLIDFLNNQADVPNGMLLLIDEAHTLPLKLLEELRLITNVIRDGLPRVRLVLAGSPALEERFANPKLEAFSQRLAARCYLEAFNRAETAQFVKQQINWVGGRAEQLFTEDALDSVHRATDGIPRLINQLCDHALMLAIGSNKSQLNAAAIDQAWADLQQLPSPWNHDGAAPAAATATAPPRADIIEFGGLDDEPATEHPPTISLEIAADWDDDFSAAEISLANVESHLKLLNQDDDDELAHDALAASEEVIEIAIESSTAAAVPDPFAEPFAEEEVVMEKYANVDGDTFAAHQQVYSQEGRVLSAMLDSILKNSSEARQVAAGRIGLADTGTADEPNTIETKPAAPAALSINAVTTDAARPDPTANKSHSPTMPQSASAFYGADFELEINGGHEPSDGQDEQDWDLSPAGVDDYDPVFPEELDPVSLVSQPAAARAEQRAAQEEQAVSPPDDLDLIIIDEDEPRITRQISIPVAPLVRRQEYRQLFARLRRGN